MLTRCSTGQRHKVPSTCVPQITDICLCYVPKCFIYVTSNMGEACTIITTVYSLIPAMLDPLIYC
ncbi:hypothetical protein D4764_12G0003520 [Takifugu flavidus]|uniref:Uncharacterized protein n=1 Tax=Takifugu flavidus TaxID=433684 RepID=A0A5C6PB25_9TELE|nr:hypothetical protein D4764_12G0003520 [Takifugu flavidus]